MLETLPAFPHAGIEVLGEGQILIPPASAFWRLRPAAQRRLLASARRFSRILKAIKLVDQVVRVCYGHLDVAGMLVLTDHVRGGPVARAVSTIARAEGFSEQKQFLTDLLRKGSHRHQQLVDQMSPARRRLYERDGQRCRFCGCWLSVDEFQLTYLMPRGRRGTQPWSNQVTACVQCMATKRSRTPGEAGLSSHPVRKCKPKTSPRRRPRKLPRDAS